MARLVAAIDIGGEDCKGVKSGTPGSEAGLAIVN
jgi:hypothetical protein